MDAPLGELGESCPPSAEDDADVDVGDTACSDCSCPEGLGSPHSGDGATWRL